MVKISSLSLLILTACSGLPNPPKFEPWVTFNDEAGYMYVMPCKIEDPKNYTFKCREDESSPLNKVFSGYFMVPASEVAAWRSWVKDVQKNYECKKK
jgi:hypothetical protein